MHPHRRLLPGRQPVRSKAFQSFALGRLPQAISLRRLGKASSCARAAAPETGQPSEVADSPLASAGNPAAAVTFSQASRAEQMTPGAVVRRAVKPPVLQARGLQTATEMATAENSAVDPANPGGCRRRRRSTPAGRAREAGPKGRCGGRDCCPHVSCALARCGGECRCGMGHTPAG